MSGKAVGRGAVVVVSEGSEGDVSASEKGTVVLERKSG